MWVFAYGSLMWRTGFAYEEKARARAIVFRRCFCLQSVYHRGTEERSGLVLGLDRGGACEGLAFRVATANAEETLRYLRAREQVTGVYREVHMPLSVAVGAADGAPWKSVTAIAYIAERAHPSYVGPLSLATQARLISGARGVGGDNLEYFINTLDHLAELGIRERELERLATVVGGYVCRAGDRGEDGKDASAQNSRVRAMTRAMAARNETRSLRLRPSDRRRFVHRKNLESGL